jgi:hypothetical protein
VLSLESETLAAFKTKTGTKTTAQIAENDDLQGERAALTVTSHCITTCKQSPKI